MQQILGGCTRQQYNISIFLCTFKINVLIYEYEQSYSYNVCSRSSSFAPGRSSPSKGFIVVCAKVSFFSFNNCCPRRVFLSNVSPQLMFIDIQYIYPWIHYDTLSSQQVFCSWRAYQGNLSPALAQAVDSCHRCSDNKTLQSFCYHRRGKRPWMSLNISVLICAIKQPGQGLQGAVRRPAIEIEGVLQMWGVSVEQS